MRCDLFFLGALVFFPGFVHAQLVLIQGSRTETFDTLGDGLPLGWSVYTSSTSNTLGTPAAFTAGPTPWAATGSDAFRNIASYNIAPEASSAAQHADANRAFGWRPVTGGTVPVAAARTGALVARLINTSGLVITTLNITLFTANNISGDQTYQFEYRVGEAGEFVPIGAPYTTGMPFGPITITGNTSIYTAISHQTGPVYLRVRGTTATGSSNLDTLGIDDFSILAARPRLDVQPMPQTAAPSGSASFHVAATGFGLPPLRYQWRKDGNDLPGATNEHYSITRAAFADTGIYDVIVTDGNGSTASTAAAFKLSAEINFNSLTATYDGSARAVSVTTSPQANLPVTLSYQAVGSTVYPTSPLPPAQSGTYAVVAAINDTHYEGTATSGFTITKAAGSLSFGPLEAGYTGFPRPITASTSPAGRMVVVTYTGTGETIYRPSTTAPTQTGTYLVRGDLDDLNHTGTATGTYTIARGTQTITFIVPADRALLDPPFVLTATSTSGLPVSFTLTEGSPAIATLAGNLLTLAGGTGPVTIQASQPGGTNYLPAPNVTRTFSVAASRILPIFVVRPRDVVALVGDPVILSATVEGSPQPTLQWRKDRVDLKGATASALSFPSVSLSDFGLYELVATNSAGTVSSQPVVLNVSKRPQTIAFEIPATTLPAGPGVTLKVNATSGLPVTLQLVSGSATLNGRTLTGTGGIVVLRATQAGNAIFAVAESVERMITFTAGGFAPFISSPPFDQTAEKGDTVSLRVSALGNPVPTYQWQKDGIPLSGATSSTLTLARLTITDAGHYTVMITNPSGSVSASATLLVRAAPAMVENPTEQQVSTGEPINLEVKVSGFPAPTFQWRRDGVVLAGATTSRWMLASACATDAGRYDVSATNALGTVTSTPVSVTVKPRNFSGDYFGRFSGAGGDFVLHVRPDNTAIFLGYLPVPSVSLVTSALTIDPTGKFELTFNPIRAVADADPETRMAGEATARISATAQSTTLRGSLDETTGQVTGALGELALSFEGSRTAASGIARNEAGVYQAVLIGSATGRSYVILAPDGEAFVVTNNGNTSDGGKGRLGADGRFNLTTANGKTLDLGFGSGTVTGTLRTADGVTTAISGAIEGLWGAERLVNLAARGLTGPGAGTLISGFVVSGSTSKQLLIRAAGPALRDEPFNVPDALTSPILRLMRDNTLLAQNDDWGTPAANATSLAHAATTAGAFPFRTGSTDAAVLTTLGPGAYTVLIGGGTGTVLAEIYEVPGAHEAAGAQRLINLSSRGVASAASPLIAGFVIHGRAPQRVLIRGIGPALGSAPFNLAGALTNPVLTLFRGATAIKTNDDWFREPEALLIREAALKSGAFALGAQSADAAMVLYLEPGAYTAQVSAAAGGAGLALVEVYEAAP